MGVTVETTKEGDNKTYPKPGDKVTMDYTGTLEDGTVGWQMKKSVFGITPGESCGVYENQHQICNRRARHVETSFTS